MSNPFTDLFEGLDSTKPTRSRADRPLPRIRGKRIGGVLYVRAEDVAEALESQAPAINSRLIAKLRSAVDQ